MENETKKEKKYLMVATNSKKMNNMMLDLQIVNNNLEEIKNRLEEIITKMLLNGDKKEIIAYTDFQLYQIGTMNDNYEDIEIEKKLLFEYETIIKETKLKILEKLKGEN